MVLRLFLECLTLGPSLLFLLGNIHNPIATITAGGNRATTWHLKATGTPGAISPHSVVCIRYIIINIPIPVNIFLLSGCSSSDLSRNGNKIKYAKGIIAPITKSNNTLLLKSAIL